MKARDIMTTKVITVDAEARTPQVARVMLANHISAVPVVDKAGAPVGMVSEGDLIGRNETERETRADWWLAWLAEGEPLSPEFIASMHVPGRTAGEVMSKPVITVGEDTDVGDIARLLEVHRIKRVPVVRGGQIVGIVSRKNLLRAIAAEDARPKFVGIPEMFSELALHFERLRREGPWHTVEPEVQSDAAKQGQRREEPTSPQSVPVVLTPDQLRKISDDVAMEKAKQAFSKVQLEEQARKSLRDAFMSEEPPADALNRIMETVRHIAEQGGTEVLVLRFPASYLDDHGRKINNFEPDWPTSLTGSAKRAFEFFEKHLKPLGYKARAQILDYPGGMPGDVGMYLVW